MIEQSASAAAPWRGIGIDVEGSQTPEEVAARAGLLWTVSKRPLLTPKNVPDVGGEWDIGATMPVADYFALVRDDEDRVLGPCGKDYIVSQNSVAMDFVFKFARAGKMAIETCGQLQGGRIVWVLARMGETFALPGGDEVRGYLLFCCPHTWGKSLVIKFTTIRVVCLNTLVAALAESTLGRGFRMPHLRIFDAAAAHEAEATLKISMELFSSFERKAHKLAKAPAPPEVQVRYLADVLQPELIDEAFGRGFRKLHELEQAKQLMDPTSPKVSPLSFKRSAYDAYGSINRQPGADLSPNTMWSTFNAITHWADHSAGRDRSRALEAAWFGPKSVLKTQALRRAVQMAEAA
jgi:phage/plasmid-like protein (TIGR03299 family)